MLLSWNPRQGAKDYLVQISDRPDFATAVENVTTDNTSYAPPMTKLQYGVGGSLYWRVAARDAGGNQGDWTQLQTIRLMPRLRLSMSVIGRLVHGKRATIKVSARDGSGHRLKGVKIRLTGPGLRAVTHPTGSLGQATFKVNPKRRGKLSFRATKAGFLPAYGTLRIR